METIKFGSTGPHVQKLQKLLEIEIDGVFGEETKKAVVSFQATHNLEADGIVGPKTWEKLLEETPKLRQRTNLKTSVLPITPEVFDNRIRDIWRSILNFGSLVSELSIVLKVDPAAIHAVIAIESAGKGMVVLPATLDSTPRPIIRFETHIFYRFWGQYHPDIYYKFFSHDPEKPWLRQKYEGKDLHVNQFTEWAAFNQARQLSATAAYESISIGLGQVMGFHWRTLGFDSPSSMFKYLSAGEREQLLTLFDFISLDPVMLTALQNKNWLIFARRYNGTGKEDKYKHLLHDRYRIAKQILDIKI